MNSHDNHAVPSRNALRRAAGAIALVAALGTVAAVGASPAVKAMHPGGHLAMSGMPMEAHIHQYLEAALADASPEQKAAVAVIVRDARADLEPVHEQLRQGHRRAHQLLTAPAIDRAALEELRVQQMQQMDQASRRMLAALEDVAEVLTPAQRARLAGHPGR